MSRRTRRLRASNVWAALILLALAGLLAACGTPSKTTAGAAPAVSVPTSPAAATTLTRTFAPYDAAGELIAAIHGHASGSCWTTSISAPAANTYRCLAGNQILDPCFAATPKASTVACFADPFSAGLLVTLSSALPKADPGTRADPWALQLADGTHCVAVTGTVHRLGSLNLDYACGASATAGLLAAAKVGAARQVEYVARTGAVPRNIAVSTAWRG
ncbi:hypothetical protein [Jatrophihabitans sp.]|uniref:hypothetical protein n=1 Tax=Jatrophihabitans sp. TaxID=1932789 RepID=UPI0030C7695B|nr:hypothetical protein [Jatrophihabitans sp.]